MIYPIYIGSISVAVILIIITVYAEIRVRVTYSKYSEITTSQAMPAYQFARIVLDSLGLQNIQIIKIGGELTDYYDHKRQVVALSDSIYDSTSVAALGVVAHEIGHAIQYKEGYAFIKIKQVLYPIANFMSRFMWVILIAGIIGSFCVSPALSYSFFSYFLLGYVVFYGMSFLFALITLPIEKNASRRALAMLKETNTLNNGELTQAKSVLDAAALTYVASLIVSLVYFLRMLMIFANFTKKK